jgi:copper chaperone CopZ
MTTTEYVVTGMSCEHCERAVQEEVSALPGVTVLTVSAPENKLVISSDAPVADEAVLAAVVEAGYTATRAA